VGTRPRDRSLPHARAIGLGTPPTNSSLNGLLEEHEKFATPDQVVLPRLLIVVGGHSTCLLEIVEN